MYNILPEHVFLCRVFRKPGITVSFVENVSLTHNVVGNSRRKMSTEKKTTRPFVQHTRYTYLLLTAAAAGLGFVVGIFSRELIVTEYLYV